MAGEWKDDRLLIRSIREGWAIPPERLPAVLERVLKIASDPASSDRDATAAVRALLMAQRVQLATIETELKLDEHAGRPADGAAASPRIILPRTDDRERDAGTDGAPG